MLSKLKQTLLVLLLITAVLLVPTIGCAEEQTHSLTAGSNASITVALHAQLRLNPVFVPDGQAAKSWKSSSSRTIAVDETGLITAKKEGSATITVTAYSGTRATIKVRAIDPYKPEKIELAQSGTIILNKDETLQLNAALLPSTARSELSWSSSSKKYASVDANGVVTGIKEGTTTITVKTYNGKKDTVKIKVVDPYKPEKIELAQSGTIILNKDETLQLNAALLPSTARSELSWSSSSKKYASVDANGMVTGIKEGTTTITVKTYNGKKDTVKIKVVDPYKPEKIELAQSGTIILNKDETLQLSAALLPSTARSELTWSSSSKKYASVNADGVVTGIKEGTTTITVKTYNGKKDTVKIKVVDPYKPTKIELTESGTLVLGRGETLQLSAALQPATARADLTWTSSKSGCASVTSDGLVTARTEGTVTITVKTHNGKKDTVKVKVVDPYKPEKIEFVDKGTITVTRGELLDLEVKMTPATARSELTWTSSNPSCALVGDVNGRGVVTTYIDGTTKITVKTHNGKKATITVRVIDPDIPDKVVINGPEKLTVTTGDTLQLSAAITPLSANQSLQWYSTNQKYVRVDSHGVLTAVSEGTARVEVYTYGGKKDSVTVKVVDPPEIKGDVSVCVGMPVRDVGLRLSNGLQPAFEQNTYFNKYLIMMTDPLDRVVLVGMIDGTTKPTSKYNLFGADLTQSMSRAHSRLTANGWIQILDMGGERAYISMKHPGMSILLTRGASGKVGSILYGDLIAAGFGEQPTHFEMDRTTLNMRVGTQEQLNVLLTPPTAQVYFYWSSNNPAVATVDQYGNVTAVGPGTATISAMLNQTYGTFCEVHVSAP